MLLKLFFFCLITGTTLQLIDLGFWHLKHTVLLLKILLSQYTQYQSSWTVFSIEVVSDVFEDICVTYVKVSLLFEYFEVKFGENCGKFFHLLIFFY